MLSGWVGVEALPQCALVQPGNWGWPLPPEPAGLCPHHLSGLLSASCFFLSVSLGAQALGKVHPPALQIQSPQPSSLMVGEVPPEPDWLALAAKQVASSTQKAIF